MLSQSLDDIGIGPSYLEATIRNPKPKPKIRSPKPKPKVRLGREIDQQLDATSGPEPQVPQTPN